MYKLVSTETAFVEIWLVSFTVKLADLANPIQRKFPLKAKPAGQGVEFKKKVLSTSYDI